MVIHTRLLGCLMTAPLIVMWLCVLAGALVVLDGAFRLAALIYIRSTRR